MKIALILHGINEVKGCIPPSPYMWLLIPQQNEFL